MSQSSSSSPDHSAGWNSVPGWIASGVLGLAVGAGGTVLAMHSLRQEAPDAKNNVDASAPAAAPAGSPPGAMPGMGGGGPPMMGMGGMGGMGGMMGGGGFGGGGKGALTSLVGKLELLSRPALKLRVELDAEQAKAIAAKLMEFDKAETMTADEAQQNLDALEALLTPEQKDVVSAIGLPRGGRGGPGGGGPGGGRGAGGRPGGGPSGAGGPPGPGGPPPGGGGMMGMGMGGGNPDENPFTQEANQKRLRELFERLSPAMAESGDKST